MSCLEFFKRLLSDNGMNNIMKADRVAYTSDKSGIYLSAIYDTKDDAIEKTLMSFPYRRNVVTEYFEEILANTVDDVRGACVFTYDESIGDFRIDIDELILGGGDFHCNYPYPIKIDRVTVSVSNNSAGPNTHFSITAPQLLEIKNLHIDALFGVSKDALSVGIGTGVSVRGIFNNKGSCAIVRTEEVQEHVIVNNQSRFPQDLILSGWNIFVGDDGMGRVSLTSYGVWYDNCNFDVDSVMFNDGVSVFRNCRIHFRHDTRMADIIVNQFVKTEFSGSGKLNINIAYHFHECVFSGFDELCLMADPKPSNLAEDRLRDCVFKDIRVLKKSDACLMLGIKASRFIGSGTIRGFLMSRCSLESSTTIENCALMSSRDGIPPRFPLPVSGEVGPEEFVTMNASIECFYDFFSFVGQSQVIIDIRGLCASN